MYLVESKSKADYNNFTIGLINIQIWFWLAKASISNIIQFKLLLNFKGVKLKNSKS